MKSSAKTTASIGPRNGLHHLRDKSYYEPRHIMVLYPDSYNQPTNTPVSVPDKACTYLSAQPYPLLVGHCNTISGVFFLLLFSALILFHTFLSFSSFFPTSVSALRNMHTTYRYSPGISIKIKATPKQRKRRKRGLQKYILYDQYTLTVTQLLIKPTNQPCQYKQICQPPPPTKTTNNYGFAQKTPMTE